MQHEAVLMDRGHPEHAVRTHQFTALYERKFGGGDAGEGASGPAPSPAAPSGIDAEIADFREKHAVALMDRGNPDNAVRVRELSDLYARKFGEQAAAGTDEAKASEHDLDKLVQPAEQPTDYDFSGMEVPVTVETVEDTELESYSREWLHQLGASPAEGAALAQAYADSLGYTDEQIDSMGDDTVRDLRQRYGADAGAAVKAAFRVADEMPGLSDFLNESGLAYHPRVVSNLIAVAERRGYFTKGGAAHD